MTEQEAEALAARLESIWKPQCRTYTPSWEIRDAFRWELGMHEDKVFCFYATISDLEQVGLSYITSDKRYIASLKVEKEEGCELLCVGGQVESLYIGPNNEHNDYTAQLERFADQWLPVFRRNCWLSGCDIEASAHEKAEWMQGFSQEELQAWNLKM